MKLENLIRYLIDTSDILIERRQEALKYFQSLLDELRDRNTRLEAAERVIELLANRMKATREYSLSGWENADLSFTKEDAEALAAYEEYKKGQTKC